MNIERFLVPRLVGTRFEGHSIPLEFLKDLAVLEEMIIEVAKAKFLEAHPGRSRAPRGFTDGIQLKLIAIEEGSAVPVISLQLADEQSLFPESKSCFESARDSIIQAIEAAEHNSRITDHLEEKTLSYFDRIGRNLRDDEAIEFLSPSLAVRARLTKETRRKLVLASSRMNSITEEVSVRGVVPEADQDDMSFEIQIIDGRKLKAPMSAQHTDTVLEAFNGYKEGLKVLLHGVGKFTRSGRLHEFESIEQISILDPLDIPARLEELGNLKDGWIEGKGQAPKREGLDWLSREFERLYPDELPLPYLYPTAEGGIQAEWQFGPAEISLEISLAERIGEWHSLNTGTGETAECSYDLSKREGWTDLFHRLLQVSGGNSEE